MTDRGEGALLPLYMSAGVKVIMVMMIMIKIVDVNLVFQPSLEE